jgi:MYND finger
MYARTAAVVKLLLAAGADVAAVSNDSNHTVLQVHASTGATAGAVCLLLKAGADPTAVDDDGSTAAHIAGIRGHFALEALLSRVADDYRKTHPNAGLVTDTACSGSSRVGSSSSCSSSSSSASSSSVGAKAIVASATGTSSSTCYTDVVSAGVLNATCAITDVCSDSTTSTGADADAVSALATATAAVSLKCGTPAPEATQQQQQQQRQCRARKTKQPCANCSKPTTKLCRRCAAVYYCSVECQKVCFKDAQHKAQCEATTAEIV